MASEVANRPSVWRWFDKRRQAFEGSVSEEGFKINRIIRYRNSFLPVLQGQFFSHGHGVRIEVMMRLHVSVIVFCLVWIGFVGYMLWAFIRQWLEVGKYENAILGPIGMLVFLYLLVTISFGIEANKARKLLARICQAVESGK